MVGRMPSTQETELAERLLANDEQVLEEILRTIGPSVRAVLRRKYEEVLGDADIEDLLSIGLYRIWVSRQRYDQQKASLRVYFFAIVDNAARDVLKYGWHKARRLEVATEPAVLASLVDNRRNGQGTIGSGGISAETMRVREVVAGLPEMQRRIVMADALCRDGSASSQLLAKELGIPASTIRVYRKRALAKLREELKHRG